jgi:single-strand DNA-binding protein
VRETNVTVVGNVAADPVVRQVGDGRRVTSLRLGCTGRQYDRARQEWVDGPTSWYGVSAWQQLGANVAESVRKGERVVVVGRLRVETYLDREGRERTTATVEADAVGHDLTFGTSRFSRVVRGSGVPGDARAGEEAVDEPADEPVEGAPADGDREAVGVG